jgi:hypothetical protein
VANGIASDSISDVTIANVTIVRAAQVASWSHSSVERSSSAFDNHDLLALQRHRAAIADEPLPLLAISRTGIEATGLDASYGPAELLRAWRRETPTG